MSRAQSADLDASFVDVPPAENEEQYAPTNRDGEPPAEIPYPDSDGPDTGIVQRKLIVLCDGTGKSTNHGLEKVIPTNVTRLARALKPTGGGMDQVVYYQSGVGTDGVHVIIDAAVETIGAGLDKHLLEAYTFFATNYKQGDILFIFGFSRGAFTARALAAFICNAGLLKNRSLEYLPQIYKEYKSRRNVKDVKDSRDSFEKWVQEHREKLVKGKNGELVKEGKFAIHKRVEIRILGLWDTVGSLGLPRNIWTGGSGIDPSYQYHDTSFPLPTSREDYKAIIWKVYQALALEENRIAFTPVLLYHPDIEESKRVTMEGTEIEQVWFPGIHADIGGGYERAYRDLCDITFAYMVDRCSQDLAFEDDLAEQLKATTLFPQDPKDPPRKPETIPQDLGWGLSKIHDEYSRLKFWWAGALDRTPGQYLLEERYDDGNGGNFGYLTKEFIHPSVRLKLMKKGDEWKPPALSGFKLNIITTERPEGVDPADTWLPEWYWEKQVKLSDGSIKTIRLDEWSLGNFGYEEPGRPKSYDPYLSGQLLSQDDWEKLKDEEAWKDIKMVPEGTKTPSHSTQLWRSFWGMFGYKY